MLKSTLLVFAAIGLVSCTSSREQLFMNMSDSELAAYNASVPETQRVECSEGIRRGTVSLVRKVCSSKTRMARLAGGSENNEGFGAHNQGFYGNRSYFDDRDAVPRIYFSAPPPGYDQPVIHVLPSNSRQ